MLKDYVFGLDRDPEECDKKLTLVIGPATDGVRMPLKVELALRAPTAALWCRLWAPAHHAGIH